MVFRNVCLRKKGVLLLKVTVRNCGLVISSRVERKPGASIRLTLAARFHNPTLLVEVDIRLGISRAVDGRVRHSPPVLPRTCIYSHAFSQIQK